jgi:transposase
MTSLAHLPKSARAALRRKNIESLHDLTGWSENEIASLNGVGRRTIMTIKSDMQRNGIAFRARNNPPRPA